MTYWHSLFFLVFFASAALFVIGRRSARLRSWYFFFFLVVVTRDFPSSFLTLPQPSREAKIRAVPVGHLCVARADPIFFQP